MELANALVHEVVIDDRQAQEGARRVGQAFDRMGEAGERAGEKGARGLRLFDDAVVNTTRAGESVFRTFDRIARSVDPVYAATQKLATAERDLTRAVQQGITTEEEKIRLMDLMRQKLAAGGVANDNFIRSQAAATASTVNMKNAMGNMGLQLQDVVVQAQMGTSAFVILAQQGPQIASAFGPVGAVIGTVVAVASVAAGAFFNMGDGMTDAERSAKSYEDTMGAVRSIIDEAAASGKRLREGHEEEALSVADLAAHYRTLSETMLQVERIRLTSEKNKAIEGLAAQRKAVADYLGDLKNLDVAVTNAIALQESANRARGAMGTTLLTGPAQSMRDLAGALKEFKAAGPDDIEAIGRLSIALDTAAKAGGPFADQAKKAAEALVDPARKSVELSTQLTRLEDGLTAVGAASMRIPLPGRKPGEAGASSFATGAKDARTFADVLDDLSDKAREMDGRKLSSAWDLVNKTLEDGLTPAERYAKRVDEVQAAMQLVQQHADTMGEGLKALSPEQIERINKALREQDPLWKETERAAERAAERVADETTIPDEFADAFGAMIMEALQ
ncbi:phage tail length tape measure family protein [Azospirillum brasilense]|uniref:phage tail length tape measure family protein n=1 Tax=Azospirillum brasilense TaxID=192 RepID=UPI000E0B3594|nr:phage tail length tape measure family protein [Azospirillum brasilense]